jgi:hypothetical protein
MGDLQRAGDIEVNIVNKTDQTPLKVNVDGSINVLSVMPLPPDTIKIFYIISGTVSGSSYIDTPWVIPNNTTFTLQRFKCGGDGTSGDSTRFYLYYDSTGYTVGLTSTIYSLFYYNGFNSNMEEDFSLDFTGDGTKSFILRRERANATARILYAVLFGYLTYNTITTNETNTATTVTATTLTRTGAGWTTNQWVGKYLRVNNNVPLYIASNTTDTITVIGNIFNTGSSIPYTIITFN